MSEKNVAETAETAEALTSSVSMLEEVKSKKKLSQVSYKRNDTINY